MSTSTISFPAHEQTIPDRITGALPLTTWEMYFQVLAAQLAAEFPESDETQRTNIALRQLQMIACGDAALRSLAQFGKLIQKRSNEIGDKHGKRKTKQRAVKKWFKMFWHGVFDF